MGSVKSNRRAAPRKEVSPIHITHMTSLDDFTKIARNCEIIEASSSGILLKIKRQDLIPTALRNVLTLESLIGDRVFMHLEEMNLEISGIITRTQLLGKQGFHVAVDYSDEAPEYWRECLIDLLPTPGEID